MAHTPDQRSKNTLCGSKKRNGELCRAFAGQGTAHPGVGSCKHHLGNSKRHETHAVSQELKKRMVTLGAPDENVTSISALLSELYYSSGHVNYLRDTIGKMPDEEIGSEFGRAIMRLYDTERDRKARLAKLASEAGVDEITIKVSETQIYIVGEALKRACEDVGLSRKAQAELGRALRTRMEELEATRPQLPAAH